MILKIKKSICECARATSSGKPQNAHLTMEQSIILLFSDYYSFETRNCFRVDYSAGNHTYRGNCSLYDGKHVAVQTDIPLFLTTEYDFF